MEKNNNLVLFDLIKKEVPYSNNFSTTVFADYTLRQKKLLLFLIAGIKNKDDDSYQFNPKLIKKMLKMESQSYKELAKLVFEIQKKPILIFNKERNRLDSISLFTQVSFLANDESIIVNFSDKAKALFLGLKGNFSNYLIENVRNLSSEKSIELYLRSESFLYRNEFTLTLEEIETFLQKKYTGNLERKVIAPAVKDITENTDIQLDYEKIKSGRNIVAFKFYPKRSSKISKELLASIEIAKKNIYISKAITFDIKTIQKLLRDFSEEELIQGLKLAYEKINKSFKTLSYLQKIMRTSLDKTKSEKKKKEEKIISKVSEKETPKLDLIQELSTNNFDIWEKMNEPLKSEIEKKALELLAKQENNNTNFILEMKSINNIIYYKTISKYIEQIINDEYSSLKEKITTQEISILDIQEKIKTEKKQIKKGKGRRKKLDMLDELDFEEEVIKCKRPMMTFLRKKFGKEKIKEWFNNFNDQEQIDFLVNNYVDFLKSKEK